MSHQEADRARPPSWAAGFDPTRFRPFGYAADAVLLSFAPVAVPGDRLGVLLVERSEPPFAGHPAFPGRFVAWEDDTDARETARRALAEVTGDPPPDYLETLDTYDRFGRDPRQFVPGPDGEPRGARVVSKAHMALGHPDPEAAGDAQGAADAPRGVRPVYDFLPWEDQRPGEAGDDPGRGVRARVALLERLDAWAAGDPDRRALVLRAFGDDRPDPAGKWRVEWNEERAGERFRLLLHADLVEEAHRNRWGERVRDADIPAVAVAGQPLAFDHRLMLADALSRLRGKIKYLPRALKALSGDDPTLVELHWAVEAVSGRPVDRGNFWRIFTRSRAGSFLEPTDRTRDLRELHKRGPQPAIYRYREDADRLRLDPSIRYPWAGPL